MKYNLNNEITLYPNEKGWHKIIELYKIYYHISYEEAILNIEAKKQNNGFKEQFWIVIDIYHSMFFNGQNYFKTMNVDLNIN